MTQKAYSYSNIMGQYEVLKDERSEWEAEWRQISDFLLPGRGVYQTYSKPRKRKLTSTKVINTVAEDALYVLASGMHGGLTSPSRPWFDLSWSTAQLNQHEALKAWLEDCTNKMHAAFHRSNFYSIISSFYIENIGFGTACTYVGEDTDDVVVPFRFELLTAGEYVFSVGSDGRPDVFMRTIFMTPRQLVGRFPKTASKELKRDVKANKPGIDKNYITIVEAIYRRKFQDKSYTQIMYEVTSTGKRNKTSGQQKPLSLAGFYEFPYPLARWGTIGSDIYGIGPGSRALPDIKRLQEMEKAFLMATHKAINPPLNVPARMRGKLKTLPGGENYYVNPNETVNEIYKVNFDYVGVNGSVERVEQRIQKNFFNDIFLTGSRDPNASPLKATQVQVQEQEKMLRLGPVIERLQHEYYQPVIERCFNIMLRKDLFEPLSPELSELVGDYDITMVSPLATAQRGVALNSINSFLAFVGQAMQIDQQAIDKVDPDGAIDEYADITGVSTKVLRPQKDVDAIRANRAKQQQAMQQKQMQAVEQQHNTEMNSELASTRKTEAEAGVAQLEARKLADEIGMQ